MPNPLRGFRKGWRGVPALLRAPWRMGAVTGRLRAARRDAQAAAGAGQIRTRGWRTRAGARGARRVSASSARRACRGACSRGSAPAPRCPRSAALPCGRAGSARARSEPPTSTPRTATPMMARFGPIRFAISTVPAPKLLARSAVPAPKLLARSAVPAPKLFARQAASLPTSFAMSAASPPKRLAKSSVLPPMVCMAFFTVFSMRRCRARGMPRATVHIEMIAYARAARASTRYARRDRDRCLRATRRGSTGCACFWRAVHLVRCARHIGFPSTGGHAKDIERPRRFVGSDFVVSRPARAVRPLQASTSTWRIR